MDPVKNRLSSITPTRAAKIVAPEPTIEENSLPLIVTPVGKESICEWYSAHEWEAKEALRRRGGIVFRGFDVSSIDAFDHFVRTASHNLLEYKERSTPRTEVGNRIYTSTEYPAHQHIAHHNEFSYAFTWPMRIFFFAHTPPQEGGQTPIADSRKVYASIPEAIRQRFEEKGVMYTRNYGTGIDLSWQEAFQTNDKAEVEAYCRRAPLKWEWLADDRLRTRQVRPAVARHPATDEMVWFNQAHLFHVTNLGPETRKSMEEIFDIEDLPRNCYFGDESPISESDLEAVRDAYRTHEVVLDWRQGDVMMLDNMLVAHGRRPYSGERRILTALSEPYNSRTVRDSSTRLA